MLDSKDAEFLVSRPEFKRFLYEVIQTAGIIGNTVAADGQSVRDQCLEWHEGRRSLGHEILLMAEEGQPIALRSPDGSPIATLEAVLREAMNPKEKPDGRRTSNHRPEPDDTADERYAALSE